MAGVIIKICHQVMQVSSPNHNRKIRWWREDGSEGGGQTENGNLTLISRQGENLNRWIEGKKRKRGTDFSKGEIKRHARLTVSRLYQSRCHDFHLEHTDSNAENPSCTQGRRVLTPDTGSASQALSHHQVARKRAVEATLASLPPTLFGGTSKL